MKKYIILIIFSFVIALPGIVQAMDIEQLLLIINKQQKQINELQKKLDAMDGTIMETRVISESTADALDANLQTMTLSAWTKKTKIGGYGEHHYNKRVNQSDEVDTHRYVLYINHDYSDKVQFFSELELEHSLAGNGKPGEVELEQAYIKWQFHSKHHLISGLFLVPVGILNETHEPNTFYGVERNGVESRVIPSTWWETGFMISGELKSSFFYDIAIHSGLKTGTATGNVRNLRIRSGRQKSAEALATNPALTIRLKYNGIAGLELASTMQWQSDITQSQLAQNAGATLLETHAIYQSGRWGLRALYSRWDINNDFFKQANTDQLSGWFIEPSYRLSEKMGLFTRYSQFDRANSNVSITDPSFFGAVKYKLFDIGLNFWLHEQVVFKLDYQADLQSNNDSFNLGIGWAIQ